MKKSLLWVVGAALMMVVGWNATLVQAADDGFSHHVVIHVDDNDKARMNIALNNAANITKYYDGQGEKIQIEIVAYGPGLHMLRADTSPVAARLETFSLQYENIGFAACGNTIKGMTKKEGKPPQLVDLDNVKVVASGVVQIMKRQDQGWNYIRP